MQTAAIVREQDPLPGGTNPPENPNYFCMEWNADNQLIRVTKDAAEVATFKYDPKGRRVEKAAGGATHSYLYDGMDILTETSGGTTYSYLHGSGIDEPMATESGGSLAYYHADGLGSIVRMTDNAGSVISFRQYDAWGNVGVDADQPGYAFTGREWDPELPSYYYRARYYDPKVGRFISEDPIGLTGGIDFYSYVENNPVAHIDPLGLQTWTTTWWTGPGLLPPIPMPPSTPSPPGGSCPAKPCMRFHRATYIHCVNAHILPSKGQPGFVAGASVCAIAGGYLTPAAGVACLGLVDTIIISKCMKCATYCDTDPPTAECMIWGGSPRPPTPFVVPPWQPNPWPPVR